MIHVEKDLFHKRVVCTVCGSELNSNATHCNVCNTISNGTNLAFIYDIDLVRSLTAVLQRLYRSILDYSQEIKAGVDVLKIRDIPFGSLYQDFLSRFPGRNHISALLHLDGVSLTKSTKLKLWLFSFAIVQLRPTVRFARYNMPIVSIWIGHGEPNAHLWLDKAMLTMTTLKSTGTDQHMLFIFLDFSLVVRIIFLISKE
jgi:hypothetical protein